MLNRRRKSRITTISYALATAALMTIVSGCTDKIIEEQQTAQIEAGVIKKLRVSNPSGDLTIVGSDQTDKIEAVAKIKRTEKISAEEFKMTFTERGEEAEFVNSLPSSWGVDMRQMDITLTVPRDIELDIADESGDIKLQKVKGDLELVDDSGDIELTSSQGNVNITDKSGEIEISNHIGMIAVIDDSGNVKIEQVKGNITIEDGSGNLRIEQIEGNVRVESDTSGDAIIEQVSGSVHNNNK
ncbi:DUF4097 domain-containing protein [Paenibacillus sp. SC116]|uniref:DUF4097 domain-containing protein n=1 Tax=Paenibacillus sp. SC116 TaxID=2968986 RepID=UPI00215B233F|nr:DUF4097 domain-containing protein [Paenibacillus sp. SC116]